ncbi:MAG: gfo/Idh/MocA family oxidoreductase [Planctomycetota bacterium]|nr:MAG: gfo/Idh/MocA family oxidoreductase [Planctomycetota bacterium]REK27415.1 MAG: gfo/Idh/MocA family oxidoreductase [Planctomycetota bacterium]REK36906.1 MAG: gfo/Idh/MocA family oxidoreductase [Planctomycetota bacterium]
MSKIKYGQIGVGHAHASKITAYRDSDDYEVIGVAEPDEELRRRAEESDAYQGLPWMTAEQLLNEPGLQVVGVETRVRDLLDTAEQCIDAGKHIHLDKPAGESLPHFERILDKAARQHLAVQMGYMYRYNPGVVRMREFLENGWLGEPFEVHTVMSKLVGASTRESLAEYRGGTMFELGCHIIDLVVGALGAPDAVHAFPRHSADSDDDLLDNMLAVFEYPAATATVRSSVNEVEGFARRHFTICGSEGTMHIQPLDSPRARVAFRTAHGKYSAGYQEIEFPPYVRYVDDAADLAKIVRQEKDPDFSYQHDLAVQECVLRASGLPIDASPG